MFLLVLKKLFNGKSTFWNVIAKHIFIQLKSSVIGKSDFADILDHFLTLNSDNTSTENFFVLTSFVPIRINEKNFKEYLDDYVNVLVNPYETDEKKAG